MANSNATELPFVSIVMPMRNEENFLARCLESILKNDYPQSRFEILVVDGMSTDQSRTIVNEFTKHHSNIRLLENPRKLRVTANNIGIKAAKGEIIISMDVHVLYASDYIRNCVELLQTTGAANVGGQQKAVGYNYITRAIAFATTTPFGIGDAEFRYSEKEKWVDTVYLGAWYKDLLDKVGMFDENWVRNGDYELNYRIREMGGKILLSPKIQCQYFVRGSLLKLAHQYFLYGKWRVKTSVTHPDSVRWRHMLPPFLVLWLMLSPSLLVCGTPLWWIPVASYLFYTVAVSLALSARKGIHYLPVMIPTLWILHLSWGIGIYCGLFRFGIPRLHAKTIINDILGRSKI